MAKIFRVILMLGTVGTSCALNAQEAVQINTPIPEAAAVADAPDGEVVVTARRQNESLRDVPATVTVLTSDTLARTGARVATDFINLTSGVTISTGTTEPSDTSVNIRGLNGARDAENNVALVIDGILKTSTAATNEPQGAISQVEILKGPQGAIYGRNASAGAIVISTRKPGVSLAGEFKGRIANDNTYLISGLISGPLSEQVGFVLNAEYTKSDGYYRNSFLPSAINQTVYPGNSRNGASIDNYDKINVFGRLLIQPSDHTEIDVKANYGHNKSGALSFNAVFQLPGLAAGFDDPIFNAPVSDHKFAFTNNTEAEGRQETYGASVRVTEEFDFATLIGSAGFNNVHNDYIAGGTSGAFGFFDNQPNCIASRAATAGQVVNQEPFETYYAAFGFAQPYSPSTCDGIQGNRRRQKDIVAELRLVGPSGTPLQWQIGGSYIYIDRRVCVNLTLDTGVGGSGKCFTTDPRFPTEALQDDSFRTNVYALFAAADYAVTEAFKVGAALRYDIEARETANNVPVAALTRWVGNPQTGFPNGTATTPANYYLNPGLDPAYNPNGVIAPRSETFKQLEPKFTLSYKASPNLTVFSSWGIGFKAGGFNSGGTQAIVDGTFNPPVSAGGIGAGIFIPETYRKETDSAFEAGLKGRLFGALNYELVGYYTNVKNMQFFEFFVGNFGLLRSVSNIDKVRIYGVEGSLNYRVTPNISVYGSGNVIDSRIRKNRSRPYTVGNKSPTTPDYAINLGAQLIEPITDAIDFTARTDVRVTGPTPFHTVQDNTVPTVFAIPGNFENSTRDTFTTVNLRVGVDLKNWSLTAFATNLFDKHYLEDVVVAPEFGGDFVAPGALRRFGVEATARF